MVLQGRQHTRGRVRSARRVFADFFGKGVDTCQVQNQLGGEVEDRYNNYTHVFQQVRASKILSSLLEEVGEEEEEEEGMLLLLSLLLSLSSLSS